jgi:hypothetical protein
MTLFELVTALNGELVCNQARVRRDGKWIVLGRVINNAWEITEAGQRLLNAANAEPATSPATEPEPPKPVRRTRVTRSRPSEA